jgi:hypothetical protein
MTILNYGAYDLWTSLYCVYTSNLFGKTSNGTSDATKITQMDGIMNKICFFQVKGVIGMWVVTSDQVAIWSLRSLDIILLFLHFKKVL